MSKLFISTHIDELWLSTELYEKMICREAKMKRE